MKNKYQKKNNKQNNRRTDHGLIVLSRTIKSQSKQKIQNAPLWSTTRKQEKEHTETTYGKFKHW